MHINFSHNLDSPPRILIKSLVLQLGVYLEPVNYDHASRISAAVLDVAALFYNFKGNVRLESHRNS